MERDSYIRRPDGLYRPERPITIKEWVQSVQIRDVVRPHIELDSRGRGHCYHGERHKHNDARESFAVNDRRQRWRCYTEGVGGDAFEFLVWLHDVDKREAYRLIRHGYYR